MTSLSFLLITSNYQSSINDGYNTYFIDASSGNVTLTLDQIGWDGVVWQIKRLDTSGNTATISAYAGDTIFGGSGSPSSVTLAPGGAFEACSMYNGSIWYNLR